MGFEVNNPFLYQLREGSIADPFVDKVETLTVVNGRLLLTEMPVKQNGVLIDGHIEIDTNTPTGTQFYVDYTNGTVYFVSTKNATVTARYKGRGLVQIPSERVYHKKGSVTRTLDTIVETVDTSAIAASNAASLANAKATAADSAATTANTQSGYAKSQGDYAKAQGDYASTATTNANAATTTANNATNAASTATTQANAARDAANTAASNANAKATLAEQKANAVDAVATKADTNANFATTQGTYAKEQGDYAKAQGLAAKDQGDYAKLQGDRVDTRLAQTNTAEQNAVTATTNAVAATQGVLNSIAQVTNQGTVAGQAAAQATSQADYAKTQGDYAKAQGDAAKAAVVGTITNKAVTSAKLDDDVQVGSLKTLKTDVKTSVTGALNEVFEDVTKSVLGSKLTSTTLANFVGKLSSNVIGNPHIAKRTSQTNASAYTTLQIPTSVNMQELSNVEYDLFKALDGSSHSTSIPGGANSAIAQHMFSFNLIEQIQRQYGITLSGTTADKVAWLKANLSKLTFNWYGYGSSVSGNRATIRRWDRVGNSWQDMARTHTGGAVALLVSSGSSNYGTYITDDGFFHALAYAEPSDGVTPSIINTDYAELLVELKTDILSNLSVATQTTAGLMSASDKVKSDNSQLWALTNSSGSGKPTGGDLSKIVTSGDYNVLTSDINGLDISGSLTVSTRGSSVVFQKLHTVTNIVYTRLSQDTGGTWSTWKKSSDTTQLGTSIFGGKFVDSSVATFLSKLSGSSSANPHIAKRTFSTWSTGFTTPSDPNMIEFTTSGSSLSYESVSSLNALNNTATTSNNGGISQHLFSFNLIEHIQRTYGTIPGATTVDKVAWIKSNSSKFTFNWFGFGSSVNGNKANIAYWAGASWAYWTSNSASSPAKSVISTSSPANLISPDGFAHFLAYAEPADGITASTINTDYVELVVEISTDILSNLNTATTTTPGVMSPLDKFALDNSQKWKLTESTGFSKYNASQDDADVLLASGNYACYSSTKNVPESGGHLYVIQRDGSQVAQTFIGITSNIYIRTYSATWKPWRKLTDNNTLGNVLLGNKFVDQSNANFVGKVLGSATANPHVSYIGAGSVLYAPSVYTSGNEVPQVNYNQFTTLDGTVFSRPTSTSASISQQLFSFNLIEHVQRAYGAIPGTTTADKVAWLKSNLSKLTFNWFGFGSSVGGNKATLAGWRDGTTWITFGTNTNATPSKTSLALTSNVSQYIDANGFVHGLVYADASDGTTASVINTDYVELNVELSTDLWGSAKPQWINATLQNSWVEFDATQTPKFAIGKDGFVDMIGAVKSGSMGAVVMNLPSGYRPAKTVTVSGIGGLGDLYRINILNNGNITVEQSLGTGGNTRVVLDGIRFPTL